MRPLAAVTVALMVAVTAACGATGSPGSAPVQASSAPEASASVIGPVAAPVVDGAVEVSKATVDNLGFAPQPDRLRVERLGVDMEIIDVGIAPDGGMELPESAGVAGWFRLGGNPAGGLREDQNTVIAAHVDDAVMGRGPFAELRDARAGDRIEVSAEDGTTVAYIVDRVEQTSKQEVDFSVVFGAPDRALVLVTCGGKWDADVRHYEDNVLVWAFPEDAR